MGDFWHFHKEFQKNTHKLNNVDDRDLAWVLLGTFTVLLSDQTPQFIQIKKRAELVVAVQMEIPHTDLSEVTRMVFVVVNSVVMHTSSVTATTGMLSVLT